MKTFKHKNNGSTMTFTDGCMKIENLVIEGTPNLDYWEEVVEKEWEILSFKNADNNQIYTKYTLFWDCLHSGGIGRGYDYCLKYYSINSAKNLKTGEVVTIGDEYEEGVVDSFSPTVFGGNLLVGFKSFYIACNILDLTPLKKPLFTTYDGVDIFERGETYAVGLDFNVSTKQDYYGSHPDNKYFAKKERAEEYVLMNKPSLSINDIINLENNSRVNKNFQESYMCSNLINIVKNKNYEKQCREKL